MPNRHIIEPELEHVRLYKAKGAKLDGKQTKELEQFYKNCGSTFILHKIPQALKRYSPKLIFFEHSYFATATEDNQYAVFVCIWHNQRLSQLQLNKFQHFFN